MVNIMKKLIALSCLSLCAFLSGTIYAASENWTGQLYGITPNHSGVTEQYCMDHALDTYQTTSEMVDKEVTAQNGVKARNLGYHTRQEGGVYFKNGTVEFSGTYEGKPWKQKVHYFSHALQSKGGMEQGVWYTKDCKGFYKVGPA